MGLETMAMASFVIGAASSVASGVSASQQAKAQAQYQEEQAAEYARVNELNNKAAAQEYVEQSAAERMAQMHIHKDLTVRDIGPCLNAA